MPDKEKKKKKKVDVDDDEWIIDAIFNYPAKNFKKLPDRDFKADHT